MAAAREFDTRVDKFVRRTGKTRRQIALEAQVSTSSLLKARALDPDRGKLHWTTLVMIGARMGIFAYGESVSEDDPRLSRLAPRRLRTTRGRGAPHWYDYQ